jgi:hypothetical protein
MEKNNPGSGFRVQGSGFNHACAVLNSRLSCSQGGMTLVEAVLAIAILGIGVFVLAETTAKCFSVIRTSRHYQAARAVLDRGESDYPLRGSNTVDQNKVDAVDYNGYEFSRDLQEVDGEKKMFVVKTKVSWSETGKDSFEEMTSYIYCPNEK